MVPGGVQISGASNQRMSFSRVLALTLVFWVLLEWDHVNGHAHNWGAEWKSMRTELRSKEAAVVIILLDGGGSMLNSVTLTGKETLLHVTTRIVSEFVDTLNKDDTVSVYKFDSMGHVSTDHTKIRMPDPSNDTAVQNEVDGLTAAMEAISASITFDAPQANLTAALEDILFLKDVGFDTSSSQTLKVLLIFTGGKLAEGMRISMPSNSSIPQALTSLSVRTFIYKWKKDQSDDSADTDLQSVACALNASYDVIPRSDSTVDDPLSALQSFYSYVAKIRHANNQGKPLWVHKYGPFTSIGVDLVAVSYPVFDGDFLVGVASMDVLQNLPFINHRTDDEIVQLPGPTLNCSANLTPADVAAPDLDNPNGGLCLGDNLNPTEYDTRTCCDSQCSVATSSSSTKFPAGAIAGIAVGGCLLLAALVCVVCFRKAILKFFGSCNECINKEETNTTQRSGEVVKQGVKSQEEVFGKVTG